MKKSKFNIILLISILGFLFLFDWCFFREGQFLLRNESPWNTNHFFNFLYEYKRLKGIVKTKPRILILGSSIAYYSIDSDLLAKELKRNTGKEFEIFYLAYAGNSPLYVYLLLDWLFPLEPDLVIYPINFIDFRLHRTYVLFPEGSNETVDEGFLIRDALTFTEAPQSLWIFPWETMREVGESMSIEQKSRYLAAGFLAFYRYQDIYFANLQNLYNHRFGRNTSYHAYMGVTIPEGINSLGWTGKKFSFFPLSKMKKSEAGIWVEVTPYLLRSGNVSLTFSNGKGEKQTILLEKSGWVQIFLDEKFFESKALITAELSRVWYAHEAAGAYLDYHNDPMGVRLQQTFGLDNPLAGEQYSRPKSTEDFRYLGMSDENYKSYFNYRLLQGLEKRPGIGYLVALEKAKKRIATEKFQPIFHLQYLKKITEKMNQKKIPILIINNPENPISLDWYEKSAWYNGYLGYLESLRSDSTYFWDFRRALPMQAFSDFHHFTYPGMEQMNPIYAKEIGKLFSK